MKIYVFGNKDSPLDRKAFLVAKRLKKPFPKVDFVEVGINSDLPIDSKKLTVILDVVEGIDNVEVINDKELHKLINIGSTSVHDFDLGFQLKYLKKIGKLKKVKIIGIPMKRRVSYLRIQSILRKLVAQDMQGS